MFEGSSTPSPYCLLILVLSLSNISFCGDKVIAKRVLRNIKQLGWEVSLSDEVMVEKLMTLDNKDKSKRVIRLARKSS